MNKSGAPCVFTQQQMEVLRMMQGQASVPRVIRTAGGASIPVMSTANQGTTVSARQYQPYQVGAGDSPTVLNYQQSQIGPRPPGPQQVPAAQRGSRLFRPNYGLNPNPDLATATATPINDEVWLCWNTHYNNIKANLAALLQRGKYTDVTVCAEGKAIRCHKIVLSSSSTFFDELLTASPANQHPHIYLRGVPFWCLKVLLDFMYVGEAHIDQSKLPEILDVAQDLKIKSLIFPASQRAQFPAAQPGAQPRFQQGAMPPQGPTPAIPASASATLNDPSSPPAAPPASVVDAPPAAAAAATAPPTSFYVAAGHRMAHVQVNHAPGQVPPQVKTYTIHPNNRTYHVTESVEPEADAGGGASSRQSVRNLVRKFKDIPVPGNLLPGELTPLQRATRHKPLVRQMTDANGVNTLNIVLPMPGRRTRRSPDAQVSSTAEPPPPPQPAEPTPSTSGTSRNSRTSTPPRVSETDTEADEDEAEDESVCDFECVKTEMIDIGDTDISYAGFLEVPEAFMPAGDNANADRADLVSIATDDGLANAEVDYSESPEECTEESANARKKRGRKAGSKRPRRYATRYAAKHKTAKKARKQ